MLDTTVRIRPTTPPEFSIPPTDELRQLGDYLLLREIGRGGMGIVYEAEQQSLHRRVALKVMAGTCRWDEQARERFQREARSAAQLHHTNIVPIFEVGLADDECYYAMQFIDGIGLDMLIVNLEEGELKDVAPELAAPTHPGHFRALAGLALQVADGLAHAHVRGVIHRDIKPANLLLDKAGVVWITDFGLAKQTDDKLTRPGDLFGTIRYMGPERFSGGGDARSDIYALGTTLYELVTRQPAYPDVTEPAHVARLAIDPPRPTSLEPNTPRDLETIIRKAMDKDPARRYQTAQEFADDLRRFLDDEPIRARPIGVLGRTVRWAKRRPVLASLTAAVLVLTATVIIGAISAAITFHDLAAKETMASVEARAATHMAQKQAQAAGEANAASQEIALLMLGVLDETDPLALSGRVFGGAGGNRTEELRPEQVLQRTLAKLDATPEIGPKVRAKLLDKIGAIYVSLGQVDKGAPLLEKALVLRRAEHGDDSLEAAETWHHIGLLHLTQRSFDPAVAGYRQALKIRERHLGPEHPLVTVTVMHLGIAKTFGPEGNDAAELLRRAQAGLRKHPGENSREYAMATAVLVAVLLQQERMQEARALFPDALRLIQKHEGTSGLGQAVPAFLQARLAAKLGWHDQATKQYKEAVQVAQKCLGEDHFLVLLGRGELASFYHDTLHDLDAAEGEYRVLQKACERSFGAQSGQTAMVNMYLSRVLRSQKRYAEAELLLADACDVMRKRKHGSLARCLHIYGEILQKQGKIAEAEAPLREAMGERKRSTNYHWYSHVCSDLATVLQGLDRPADAAAVLRESNLHLIQHQVSDSQLSVLIARRGARQYRLFNDLGQQAEADQSAAMALDALRTALKTRALTVRNLETDIALNPLRERAEFRDLLAQVKQ